MEGGVIPIDFQSEGDEFFGFYYEIFFPPFLCIEIEALPFLSVHTSASIFYFFCILPFSFCFFSGERSGHGGGCQGGIFM
jgi:hypothetical protein